MQIAFLSDIHGNYPALKEVFNYLNKNKITKIYCLGDYVNYYYQPQKCIDLLIRNKAICIKGNHENIFLRSLKYPRIKKKLSDRYGNSVFLNEKNLKKKHIHFLKSLPTKIETSINNKKFLIAHGAPWDNNFYFYKDVKNKWKKKIESYNKDFIILGHTHRAMNLKVSKKLTIMNPGSIGQPRDNYGYASWLLLETDKLKFQFIKTKYNLDKIINQIKKNDPNNNKLLKYFK